MIDFSFSRFVGKRNNSSMHLLGKKMPYDCFSAEEWAGFRADTPLTLQCSEVKRLCSLGDPVDLREVERIYLSLSRLLSCHVESSQILFQQRRHFLKECNGVKTPFIIGIAGSVAVGKSTTARILEALLKRWPSNPKVDLITTDGFLYSNAILRAQNRMERKGFPDSYNIKELLWFLSMVKAGMRCVKVPVYSHLSYDVQENEYNIVDCPDILIVEGVNVLQVHDLPSDGRVFPFVSDFFDFSIYIDASVSNIHQWYIDRFFRLRETAFKNSLSFFHRYANMDEKKALDIAEDLWKKINLKNLEENILPTRLRADLILQKGSNHLVKKILLRKL